MMARRSTALATLALLVTAACGDDEPTPTAPNTDVPAASAVFIDGFADNVTFSAFVDSKADAVEVDPTVGLNGSASLKVTVPGPGDASGFFAGGALVSSVAWDLSEYDVLTFWARADKNATLNVAGVANDNTGASQYMIEAQNLDISGVWQKFYVPLPDPSVLSSEAGLFFFAEAHEDDAGYTVWFDNVAFETLGASLVRAAMTTQTLTVEVGGTAEVTGLTATLDAGGVETTVSVAPRYYTFQSTNEAVATVAPDGTISVVGDGSAVITATLGAVAASGTVTISTGEPLSEPAPTPTPDAADVISIYSNHYTNVTVDTWSAFWDNADVEDAAIAGDDMKLYTNLVFAGIEFTSQTIDAREMTHFHMDIWTPDTIEEGNVFKIKLVDFGADGVFGGGDEVEHEISIPAPTLKKGEWVSVDVPLTEFVGLTTREHLAQLIISGDPNTVYMDNVYLYKGGAVTAPSSAAPTPTYNADKVISLFSDAYTDVTVDSWSTVWDNADVADETVAGDAVKLYTNLVFAGIETTSATIDATSMTHFRMDIWTPDPTDGTEVFRIKLVDFGPDGAFDGGDDTEHELTLSATSTPAIGTGAWFTLEIPLSEFTGLTTRAHMAQYILSGDLSTVYVDNVLFYEGGPAEAAPTPTYDPADVISLFSDAYTDVAVDTWSTVWDNADVADEAVAGDAVKKYSNLVFAGIETTSATIDATAMTHFRMDFWTPDATDGGEVFRIKLVDFGPDGAFDGGDDTEHEITLSATSTPAIGTGSWFTLNVPLSDFAGLTTQAHMAQYILSGDVSTVYVDNVLFYRDVAVPATAAPDPTDAEADVISLFSDAYTDVTVDTWSAVWDNADVEDIAIAGNAAKRYTNLVFAGIEFTSQTIDATAMTHFRFDFWTPDPTAAPAAFKVKLVDFGPDGGFDGGDDAEHEITIDDSYAPALATGNWISYDIPLSEFTGLTTTAHLAQLIISGDPNTVILDNIYLRR